LTGAINPLTNESFPEKPSLGSKTAAVTGLQGYRRAFVPPTAAAHGLDLFSAAECRSFSRRAHPGMTRGLERPLAKSNNERFCNGRDSQESEPFTRRSETGRLSTTLIFGRSGRFGEKCRDHRVIRTCKSHSLSAWDLSSDSAW
jgi:hypothetical protein